MGWYDEAFRHLEHGRWPRESGRYRGGQGRGYDRQETQGVGYGQDYRGRAYPWRTGYRAGSEGDFAGRAPWSRDFDPQHSRTFYYDRDFAGPRRGGPRRAMSDNDVRESVRENLFQDSYVDPIGIHVAVDDGVVTLTGTVDDYLEARYAWDDAWESPGVRGVINKLEVREGE